MTDRYGRNESHDILDDLNSNKVERQKDAVKKVKIGDYLGNFSYDNWKRCQQVIPAGC